MSTSIFIARLIGPVMLVIGLAVLTNQRAFREMADEFLASRALLFLSGLIIMPVGLAIVLTQCLDRGLARADHAVGLAHRDRRRGAAVRAGICVAERPRHAEAASFHNDRRRVLDRGWPAVLPVWTSALKEPDLRKGATP